MFKVRGLNCSERIAMKPVLVAYVVAAVIASFSSISYSDGAFAAAKCESVPPNKKAFCCARFPSSPACR